ncbi:hypothetical protein KUF83_29865 [Streptomyces sp. BV286]|uniref:hypothetical protein n=1 Tax=Streptomyces sp. BV286 TaxID=2849672 RepID=UPI001C2E1082|nr:hypothetical protein [Streptomyces sp. BV286]MBV1940742.1 hypothetical protein [Streptomyces sp. BV286]
MNVFTCGKCGELYNAGVSMAKRHVCRQRQATAGRQTTAEWRKSLGWREGQGFIGARRLSQRERRDLRMAAAWGVLAAIVSILPGGRVRRTDWVKAARQPRAGGFGAGGDGGSAGG